MVAQQLGRLDAAEELCRGSGGMPGHLCRLYRESGRLDLAAQAAQAAGGHNGPLALQAKLAQARELEAVGDLAVGSAQL